MKYITTIGEQQFEIEILDDNRVAVNGQVLKVDFESISRQPVYSLLVDGKSYEAYIYETDEGWEVLLQGTRYPVQVVDEREHRLRAAFGGGVVQSGDFHLKAPMPGLVVSVPVKEGQEVEAGDVLVILESMKMQNELKSPRAGTVSRVRVKSGDNVERGQTMLSVV
ncbi:MAG: biotin/lipoyl-binding protein [Anaerolineae bacterium]|nr:MAG: biotin/lipoyl-binding protein [Anaerolineae bacterium]